MRKKGIQKTFAFTRKDRESSRNSKGKLFRREHLWIVLTNPNSEDKVGIITVSSVDETKQQNHAFIIQPGKENHPFITRPSYVRYDAKYFDVVHVEDIKAWIKSKNATRQDDVREALVDKIIHNVETNGEANSWVDAFIKDNRHNPPPQPK